MRGILASDPDWMNLGYCRIMNINPHEFYPDDAAGVARARLHCQQCDVSDECLTFALEKGERWGVWGGTSERQRERIARARRRGQVTHVRVA